MAAQAVPSIGQALKDRPRKRACQGLYQRRRGVVPSLRLHEPRDAHALARIGEQRGQRQRQHDGALGLRGGGKMRAEIHRWRQIEPNPDRVRGLHSRSRTNRWLDDPAERRQSISVAESPCSKLRYCQKVSPGPGRRLPCVPCATVEATRRASTNSAGSLAARSWAASSSAMVGVRALRSNDIEGRLTHYNCAMRPSMT